MSMAETKENMNNFALNVRARSKESFEHAMQLAFAAAPGHVATHWSEHPKYGLVLFWSGNESITEPHKMFHDKPILPFPYKINCITAIEFVWNWLEQVDRKKFELGGGDVHYRGDGDSEKAWRVYIDDWGRVAGVNYSFCAILPVWAWIGK